jgi:arabinofuranosyltransferase
MSKTKIILIVITVLFAALFIYHALLVWFTQDDAYISYRYVKNFLNGEGLVFNSGERVEGYTNFFLIILMIFFGRLGLDYIVISKIIGIASGIGILVLMILWLYKIFKGRPPIMLAIAALWLLVTNGVLAYWSVSGLETLLFTALIFWGLYLVSNKNLLFVPIMVIATLTRPEGGLVFILILIYLLITKNHRLSEIGKLLLMYIVLLLPQFIFRLYYYHEILPNPFYAKTGWSVEYFQSGLQYVWLFMKHYGFYGALVLLPLVYYKQLPKQMRLLLIVVYGYMIYILLVGGDVLHGDRFFVPILAPIYLLLVMTIYKIAEKIFRKRKFYISAVSLVIVLAIGAIDFMVPQDWIQSIRVSEQLLINKILRRVDYIKKSGAQKATIACTTIGALSYNLDGCIIDMLGLTDSTIAKHPQAIAEIASTWKERNYNIPYIMKRQPDIILFSTGIKPSAPAEKALFLSSKFRNRYFPVYYQEGDHLATIYKRKSGYKGEDRYLSDPGFINAYADAWNDIMRKDFNQALKDVHRSIDLAPPDFYLPYVLCGSILLQMQRPDEALDYFKKSFQISDGYDMQAGDMLRQYYLLNNDTAQANVYYRITAERNKLQWSD